MDPDCETPPMINTASRSAQSDPCLHFSSDLACSHGAQSTPLPSDRGQAMDVDEVTSRPLQLAEDVEREQKRARQQQIQTARRGPLLRDWPDPYWMTSDWTKYRTDEEGLKLVEFARRIGPAIRAKYNLQRVKLDAGIKEDNKVLFEKTEEMKPPCKEYGAPDLENVGHLSESPEQSGGLTRSNIHQAVDPTSDAFIEQLGRTAKAYFERINKQKFDEEEIVKNGFQYMNDEAFLAFRNYVAEHDLFEDSDYQFGKVLHHCFTAEGYGKVYTHFNFTVDIKKKDENDWTSRLYFAEAKLVRGVKFYFCAPLEGVAAIHVLPRSFGTPLKVAMKKASNPLDRAIRVL
ncbi:hypothetical protein EJB05_04468 [Eragrostis curvula]|uniref:DUF3615 domain-containing protein n=1 Tax=Eragrostis curvula TaxID=38414 RepID=A0A5J9WAG9_9POAL|nr:hypothetical protein EJB05_04468 [Eragrostis curvula]